jgi:hypothetical protein
MLALDTGPARLGAIEALGRRAQPGDVELLTGLLLDGQEDPTARTTAAAALEGVRGPGVVEALAQVLATAGDEGLVEMALGSLAARPWAESKPLVRSLLSAADDDAERTLLLLESLSDSTPEAAEVLFEYARDSTSAESRSAAIESLALLEDGEGRADQLRQLSVAEHDPEVRSELYEALALHADWSAGDGDAGLVAQVLAESAPGPRLQGFRMLASRVRFTADPLLIATFDREVLPWLESRAAEPSHGRSERLTAIDALKLAGTPAARRVIENLASGRDPVISPAAEKARAFPALR